MSLLLWILPRAAWQSQLRSWAVLLLDSVQDHSLCGTHSQTKSEIESWSFWATGPPYTYCNPSEFRIKHRSKNSEAALLHITPWLSGVSPGPAMWSLAQRGDWVEWYYCSSTRRLLEDDGMKLEGIQRRLDMWYRQTSLLLLEAKQQVL